MCGSWWIKHGSASDSRALCTPKPIGLKLGVGTAAGTQGWPSGCERRARSRDPASPSDGAGDKSPLCSAQTDGTAGIKPTQKRGWDEAGGLGLCLGAFTLKKGARHKQWDGAAGCLRARAARGVSTVGSLRLSLSSPQPLEARGMAAGLLLSVCCS